MSLNNGCMFCCCRKMREEVRQLEEKIAKNSEAFDSTQSALQEFETNLSEARTRIEELTKSNEILRHEKGELEASIGKEVTDLRVQLEYKENVMEKKVKELEKTLLTLSEMKSALEALREQLMRKDSEKCDLECTVQTLQADVDGANQRLQTCSRELSEARNQVVCLQTRLDTGKSQREQMETQLQQEAQAAKSQLELLQMDLEDKDDTIQVSRTFNTSLAACS